MRPTYLSGDTLLGWRWFTPRPGRVVVARGPDGRALIKRIAMIDAATGDVILLGDNAAASTDSRTLGAFPRTALVAVIIAKLP